MKTLQRTATETPKATLLTIVTIITGLLDLFMSFSTSLELPDKLIAWVGLIGGAIVFVINSIINNNLLKK